MKREKFILLKLFMAFLKIGAFTFGGGYAMIPLITHEAVKTHKWIEEQDILDIMAIAESTPGPIAVNAATFVGFKTAGFKGAVCATVGVILPSFLIIFAISFILEKFESLDAVRYAFNGIRAGVLALILNALISMYRQCPKNLFSYVIMASSFAAAAVFDVNVLIIIAACAAAGIISAFAAKGRFEK